MLRYCNAITLLVLFMAYLEYKYRRISRQILKILLMISSCNSTGLIHTCHFTQIFFSVLWIFIYLIYIKFYKNACGEINENKYGEKKLKQD